MKHKIRLNLVLVLLAVLVTPATVLAKSLDDDRVVVGGSFTLNSDEIQAGNLVILGGVVVLEQGSRVEGDILLLGGSLSIDGEVTGNVSGFAGTISLTSHSIVRGDLTTVAASLQRDEGSRVDGQVVTSAPGNFRFTLPGNLYIPETPKVNLAVSPIWGGIWFLFRTFLWAALAVLVAMFLPNPLTRTSEAAVHQPVLTAGLGLLTVIIAPVILVAIGITIILIPISLVAFLMLGLAWFLGILGLGLEVGRRLQLMFKKDWPLPVAAGIGTFVLVLVVEAAWHGIPCVGWLMPVGVGIIGLGAALLTRLGTQAYVANSGMPLFPLRPAAPLAPVPSVETSAEVISGSENTSPEPPADTPPMG